jgi:hypothetical protein
MLDAAAELAALRKDAERYRWLRAWLERNEQLLCVDCQPTAGAKVGPYWVFRRAYMVDGTCLEGYGKTEEEAIDAAMKQQQEHALQKLADNAQELGLGY